MTTLYDVSRELTDAFFGGGSVIDLIGAMLKGIVVGFMIDGMCQTSLGIVLKPMMAIFGLGDQVDQIQEAIESGDPAEIAVRFVQLVCMLFGLTSQCFTGNTPVSTEEGLTPIKDIEVGNLVWSEDTETGEVSLKEVLSVHVSETDTLVHLTTESGTKIDTTEGHPFYVEGKGWVRAGELEAGDRFVSQSRSAEAVTDIEVEYLDESVRVYNLEIEGSHTYFVSDDAVLVHNECYKIDSNGRGHRANGQFASNEEMGIVPSQIDAKPSSHGNSLSDPRTNYGYALLDKDTSEILKFGESIHPSSRFSKGYLDKINAVMVIMEEGSKRFIHEWQHDMNEYYKARYDMYPPENVCGW